jgi:hypothetical protein
MGVEDVSRNIPRIYATLEDQQVDHQFHVIEIEGKIVHQPIVVLIDSRVKTIATLILN